MNEKEARKIIKKYKTDRTSNTRTVSMEYKYVCAQGYLEAIEKAKEMERVLREHMQCICNPQNDITCVRCDTLRQWEKEK